MKIEDCWVSFAAAVIDRAVQDRKEAQDKLLINPDNDKAKEIIRETGKFFSSLWCEELLEMSNVKTDGDTIKEIIDEC